jgi:hypothetical protein
MKMIATLAVTALVACSHPPPAHVAGERLTPKVVTRPLIAAAEAFLAASGSRAAIGSEQYETIDGRPYVLVIEWHYHPPGYVGAPNGWHKGVTVYELR